jgi:hypothetical protein
MIRGPEGSGNDHLVLILHLLDVEQDELLALDPVGDLTSPG